MHFPLLGSSEAAHHEDYYEESKEVEILPEGSRSWFGMAIRVGPGLCPK
jgi:hypothetical protein